MTTSQQISQQAQDGAKSFEARFARLIEATKAKSDSDLARILGIQQGSISAAKKRQQIPTGWVELIAEKFDVSSDWLYFGIGSMKRGEFTGLALNEPDVTYVPKVEARLCAGNGSLETSGDETGRYAFRTDWITSKGSPKSMVLMEIIGDSMEPEIRPGDTVLIDRSRREIYAGAIYAIGLGDEVLVKMIDRAPGGYLLRSLNPRYEPMPVDFNDESINIRIIGRVIWWCREAR